MAAYVRRWVAALAGCLLALSAQAGVRLVDDRGHALELAQPAQRVITLLPSLTEAVCALQACDRLVGTDRFSDWPASVLGLPKLGGMEDTPIERIITLKPDLVLAAVSSRAVDRLESLGVPVLTLEAKSLSDTHRVLETVARALGKPGQGDALFARVQQRMAAAAARLPARWRGQKVYFEVADAPYAAGEASFLGEILAQLGLGNVVPASMGPFPKLNPEFVVRAQPAVMMATARAVADMPKRPGWSGIRALQHGQVCGFAQGQYETMVHPGPRQGETAEMIVDCLIKLPAPAVLPARP